MFVVFLILSLLLFLATFVPMSRSHFWFVRDLDFPRLQLATIATLLIVGILISSDIGQLRTGCLAGLCAISWCYQVFWIIPYTPLFPKEVPKAKTLDNDHSLAIFCANVLMTNHNSGSLIERISTYEPDVLVTLETNDWWEKQLSVLEKDYIYSVKCPQDNLYGMHVYSKLPLENSTIEFLIDKNIPSIHTCVTLNSGSKIRLHFLHPTPPSPTENESSSERDAELILVAKAIAKSNHPVIVAGDLNDVAWSKTIRLFRHLSGLRDPRRGRGIFNTFHADYWFMRWPLDHLFHSQHFNIHTIKRIYIAGSDHFSLFTKLYLEKNTKDTDTTYSLTDEEKALVKERENEQNSRSNEVPNPLKKSGALTL